MVLEAFAMLLQKISKHTVAVTVEGRLLAVNGIVSRADVAIQLCEEDEAKSIKSGGTLKRTFILSLIPYL